MKEILSLLIEQGNTPLATEVILLIIARMLAPRLVAMASKALEDNLPLQRFAGYVNQAFRLGLPVAILFWFVSILFRHL